MDKHKARFEIDRMMTKFLDNGGKIKKDKKDTAKSLREMYKEYRKLGGKIEDFA